MYPLDKEYLIKSYWLRSMPLSEIAITHNVSTSCIHNKMKKFNVARRTISQSKAGNLNPMYGRQRHLSDAIKKKIGRALKGRIPWNKGKKATLATRMKESLAQGGTGIPYESNVYAYEFYIIAPKIRKRDNYTCQLCRTPKKERKLDVHHIDYNKFNNNPDNLICLCHNCNMKANKNRVYWSKFYSQLLSRRLLC